MFLNDADLVKFVTFYKQVGGQQLDFSNSDDLCKDIVVLEVNRDDINSEKELISKLSNDVIDIKDDQGNSISFDDLKTDKIYKINIYISSINSIYCDMNDLLKKCRFQPPSLYYVRDLGYLSTSNPKDEIKKYNYAQILIKIIKEFSDSVILDDVDNKVTLMHNNVTLTIDLNYTIQNLMDHLSVEVVDGLRKYMDDGNSIIKQQLMLNELINIQDSNYIDSITFFKQLLTVVDNLKKSYSLFVKGFSFEQIKANSIEYFHDLTDRIHGTVLKFSAAIFAIPISFIFLINSYDFTAKNFCQDTVISVIGVIFFFLIQKVLIVNIKDGVSSIKNDIEKFISKIENEKNLISVKKELLELQRKVIPIQDKKVLFVNISSWIIFCINVSIYIFIYWSKFPIYWHKIFGE